jgi:type IV fimbrial biogenesis protein FimT
MVTVKSRRNNGWSFPGGRSTAAGFTVIELMIAIVVLGVLLALAVPNFNDATLSARLNGFASSLVASAQVARSEAIKRNATITLCTSTDGATCAASGGWEQGWIVVNETTATVIQHQQALPSEFKVTEAGGAEEVAFPGTVVGTTPATLTVCRLTPVGSEERVVTINGTGTAYVTITTAGSCS